MIVNLHVASENIGDKASPPLLYFRPKTDYCILDFRDGIPSGCSAIIVGGGAILNQRIESPHPRIAWGAGHASENLGPHLDSLNHLSQYAMAGVRDGHIGKQWVPCASCMHPVFDSARRIKPDREFVFYEAKNAARRFPHRVPPFDNTMLPRMGNDLGTIEEAVEFLASGETVVTNSYHGVYWGLLLGRKVIAIPYSSKFYHFPIPVPMRTVGSWQGGTHQAKSFPDFLNDCRRANRKFAEDVFSFLGVDWEG